MTCLKFLITKCEAVSATSYMKGCWQVGGAECLEEAWWQRPAMCLESLHMVDLVWSTGQHCVWAVNVMMCWRLSGTGSQCLSSPCTCACACVVTAVIGSLCLQDIFHTWRQLPNSCTRACVVTLSLSDLHRRRRRESSALEGNCTIPHTAKGPEASHTEFWCECSVKACTIHYCFVVKL